MVNRAQREDIVMHAHSWRGYYYTISFRVSELDEVRIQAVMRKYKVPFGISRSSRMRALFRILVAAENKS